MDGDARRRIVAGLAAAVAGATVLAVGLAVVGATAAARPLPPWQDLALHGGVGAVAVAVAWLVLRVVGGDSDDVGDEGTVIDDDGRERTRFQVDVRGGKRIVRAVEIRWIEAAGNYVRLHLADVDFLYRRPLARLEGELPSRRFLRVHRSAIVNLDAVRQIEPLPSGDAELTLDSGRTVRLSRRYAKAFHERTGRAF